VEKPGEPFAANAGQRRVSIDTDPRRFERPLVQIRAENLNPRSRGESIEHLDRRDRYRVGFFTAGAAGDPYPEQFARPLLFPQRPKYSVPQRVENGGFLEEAGRARQEIAEKFLPFLRIVAEIFNVLGGLADRSKRHAAQDLAPHQFRPIVRQVGGYLAAQNCVDSRQFLVGDSRLFRRTRRKLHSRRHTVDGRHMLRMSADPRARSDADNTRSIHQYSYYIQSLTGADLKSRAFAV